MSEQPPTSPTDHVEPIDLNAEMQRSYIEYAMSVIVSRALPDVRDGLKPVHRRVLYAMYDGGYRPDRGFSKCSRVVGNSNTQRGERERERERVSEEREREGL